LPKLPTGPCGNPDFPDEDQGQGHSNYLNCSIRSWLKYKPQLAPPKSRIDKVLGGAEWGVVLFRFLRDKLEIRP
jgi:hypothetical protein